MLQKKILVIFPERRATRIAIYRNTEPMFLKTIKHAEEDLSRFIHIPDQTAYRRDAILAELKRNDFDIRKVEIIMARSGLVKPLKSGIYRVNTKMVEDLKVGIMGVHETNLGGLIAFDIAAMIGKSAFMADPVVVDELSDLARITGHPLFVRKSIFHALSHKYFARKYAKSINRQYEDLNLIVCHVGLGGISIGAHQQGMVVDVNQAFDGGGPFSITRTGTLPVGQLISLCFSGKYSENEIREMVNSKGGYSAYLGTDSISQINAMIAEGNKEALMISEACAYQVSKEISSHYATLEGEVDAIILTGNIFNSELFLENVKKRIGKLATLALYPTVNDLEAHAWNALRVIKGEVEVIEYE
ncbi:MAG: butyrate kinase [Bacteroidetes bacterium HGW-Bacteroidetes-1]|jgi:butyrate kinase|nr:MAG: butyrate kinase [Bacteroidetes bacterium HGW-Bacteroidetes-1]